MKEHAGNVSHDLSGTPADMAPVKGTGCLVERVIACRYLELSYVLIVINFQLS